MEHIKDDFIETNKQNLVDKNVNINKYRLRGIPDITCYKPFPLHKIKGNITPSKVSFEQMDNNVIDLYEKWKAEYLIRESGNFYYIYHPVNYGLENQYLARSTSEMMGLGMIIIALLGGYDQNAQKQFDGLYKTIKLSRSYNKENSKINDNNLVSWVIQKIGGPLEGSSTYGDIQIAYSLVLAFLQWKDKYYIREAKALLNDIFYYDLNNYRTKQGDWQKKKSLITKPGDWAPAVYQIFRKINSLPWIDCINTIYNDIEKYNKEYPTGLIPDFAILPGTIQDSKKNQKAGYIDSYHYNSCKYPINLSLDYLHNKEPRAKNALKILLDWVEKENKSPFINAGYRLNGKKIKNNPPMPKHYGDICFSAPITAACIIDKKYQNMLDKGWEKISNYKSTMWDDAYSMSINLMSALIISGNWWASKDKDFNSGS